VCTTHLCRYAPRRSLVHVADCRFVASSKYDIPPGIPPPPSHERTRRWEPGPSQSNSRSPTDRQSHPHSHPPSRREQDVRSERAPLRTMSHEQISRGSTSTHSLTEESRVHGSVTSGGSDDDDSRPAALHRFHSPSRDKIKGKQRGPSRSLSPPPDSGILCDSPVTCRERTGSPEILTTTTNLSLFNDTSTKRTTATADTPYDDVQSGETSAPPSQNPKSNKPTRIPVASYRPPDGSTSIVHTTQTTDSSLPLEGLHSLNNGIVSSPKSELDTSEHLPINHDYVRTKPMRQPRYRSQRDSIIAYLQPSSTTPRRPSSIQPRPAPTLLARISDGPVVKPNSPEGDADITEEAGGEVYARLPSPTAERGSSPSVDDDPSEKRKEAVVTKAGTPRILRKSYLPRNAGASRQRLCRL